MIRYKICVHYQHYHNNMVLLSTIMYQHMACKALNSLAEGTAALRRISAFLALEDAKAPRPPMSEDQEMPLLLAPGGLGVEIWL